MKKRSSPACPLASSRVTNSRFRCGGGIVSVACDTLSSPYQHDGLRRCSFRAPRAGPARPCAHLPRRRPPRVRGPPPDGWLRRRERRWSRGHHPGEVRPRHPHARGSQGCPQQVVSQDHSAQVPGRVPGERNPPSFIPRLGSFIPRRLTDKKRQSALTLKKTDPPAATKTRPASD